LPIVLSQQFQRRHSDTPALASVPSVRDESPQRRLAKIEPTTGNRNFIRSKASALSASAQNAKCPRMTATLTTKLKSNPDAALADP